MGKLQHTENNELFKPLVVPTHQVLMKQDQVELIMDHLMRVLSHFPTQAWEEDESFKPTSNLILGKLTNLWSSADLETEPSLRLSQWLPGSSTMTLTSHRKRELSPSSSSCLRLKCLKAMMEANENLKESLELNQMLRLSFFVPFKSSLFYYTFPFSLWTFIYFTCIALLFIHSLICSPVVYT